MSFPSRILSLLTGGAAAQTVAKGLEPRMEEIRQDSWRKSPVAQLDVMTLGLAVAKQLADEGSVADNAAAVGYSEDKLRMAAKVSESAPGVGELLRMLLRGKISQQEAIDGLKRQAIPEEYHAALLELEFLRLSPADLANILQQNVADGFSVDSEAKDIGLTSDRLQVLYRLAGFPPPTEMALMMWRRGIIDQATFDQMIREGRTKDKYIPVLEAIKADILSPATYVTAFLKGWISRDAMNAGVALSGLDADQADLMYKAAGRPAAPGQMYTALARGVDGPDGTPMDEAQFQKGIQESDIRPEWGPMLYGIRYTYPALFMINRLVTAGSITVDTAVDWAVKDRLAPDAVEALRAFWSKTGAAKADPYVKSAATKLFTAAHKAYVGGVADVSAVESALSLIGVDAADQGTILAYFNEEKALTSKHLSAANIRKAYKEGTFTFADAQARLEALGYTAADATVYLNE